MNLSNINDSVILIHDTTFSYLPFKVYFPKNEQYLVTNLTKKQLFTAGGSGVDYDYYKNDYNFLAEFNQTILGISDKAIFQEPIFEVRGVYVTKYIKED